MFLLALTLLVSSPERIETGDNNLRVSERVEHFEVPGRNYRQFYRNIEHYGPEGRFSWYRFQLDYEYDLMLRGDSCQVDNVYVYLDHIYRMPRWTRYEDARSRDREVFDELYEGQLTFLGHYAAISQRGARGMLDDLRSLDGVPCDTAAETVNTVANAWIDGVREAMAEHEEAAGEAPMADTVCRVAGSRLRRCRT